MTRTIVKSIGDMPGEARDGLPLGCVLDNIPFVGPMVVAYGEGGTFSAAGLRIVPGDAMHSYLAYFEDDPENEPVRVRAIDLNAALMWYRENYDNGEFSLYVVPASTHLGVFKS